MMNISPVNVSRNAAHQPSPAADVSPQSFQSVLASHRNNAAPGADPKTSDDFWPPIASNYESSVKLGNEIYNDALFARDIQIYTKVTVKTDKKINWGSTGEHQLTPKEINKLKARYDVTRLSAQDYYDLVADLTNLNAITPREAVFKYYLKFDMLSPGDRFGIFYSGDSSFLGGSRNHPFLHRFQLLLDGKRYLSWGKAYVKTDDFREDNDALFSSQE